MTDRLPDAPICEQRVVYVAFTNTDLTEGRGWEVPLAVCETEATARRLAKKGYVMGTDAPVYPINLLRHEGDWYAPMRIVRVIPSTTEDDRVQQALDARRQAIEKAKAAGLTDDDLKAIGGQP